MTFTTESFVYDPRPHYPFVITANRYRHALSQQDGFTLLLAHGIGFHKEHWEPTLRHLFALSEGSTAFPIREAWSVECPNHGESAVQNEETLQRGGYGLVFSWGEYTHALWLFMTQCKLLQSSRKGLIAIGHSMGACCLALTQTYPQTPSFSCIVMCEPTMAPTILPKDHPALRLGRIRADIAEQRRDIWSSRKDAYEIFRTRKSFAGWDDEILRIFVEKGLRSLPTAVYPEHKEGVTLKCPKSQEAACYRDDVNSRRIYEYLPTLCAKLPVHIIWGDADDQLHTDVKRLVTDAKSGRKMSSVSRVKGAGHLIMQTAPKALAELIFSAVSNTHLGSRL